MAEPVRIAVMGVTGAGKSSFIRTASEIDRVEVGHDLESCTAIVTAFQFQHQGKTIELIDTPGFNDTTRTEAEVLRDIADWLDHTYRNFPNRRLNGIIYLQSITDPRMLGSSLRHLKMFEQLCGDAPLKNVKLVTTRWGLAKRSGEMTKAENSEEQLRTKKLFWKTMLDRGSTMSRFEDTRASALQTIDQMVDQKPITLQIQSEMVDQKKGLMETSAGATVNEEVSRLEKQHADDLARLQKEMQEALSKRDRDYAESLKLAQEESELKLAQVRQDQDLLRYQRRTDERRYMNELTATQAAFAKQQRIMQQQVEELLNQSPQKLSFDTAVNRLEAKSDELRPEQKAAMEAEIKKQKQKPKNSRTVLQLLLALIPLVGNIVLALLGLGGIHIPNLSSLVGDDDGDADGGAEMGGGGC